ncbi:hypothetical protein BC834DRAFT_625574 [Gloeopeniophorella convolvens]|nr:hypothetical protein BC834DRAFT_625574 [Gloeopeniophorella convolvens]
MYPQRDAILRVVTRPITCDLHVDGLDKYLLHWPSFPELLQSPHCANMDLDPRHQELATWPCLGFALWPPRRRLRCVPQPRARLSPPWRAWVPAVEDLAGPHRRAASLERHLLLLALDLSAAALSLQAIHLTTSICGEPSLRTHLVERAHAKQRSHEERPANPGLSRRTLSDSSPSCGWTNRQGSSPAPPKWKVSLEGH